MLAVDHFGLALAGVPAGTRVQAHVSSLRGADGTASYALTLDDPNAQDAPDIRSGMNAEDYYHSALGYMADRLHTPTKEATWVDMISERTCERACMRCELERPVGVTCDCYANCVEGPLGTVCEGSSDVGWARNHVTRPDQTWQAVCTRGSFECQATCLSDNFLGTLQGCRNSDDKIGCEAKMKALYAPILAVPQGGTVYCTRRDLPSCDAYATVPHNGTATFEWECFSTHSDCVASMQPEDYATDPRLFNSVWENVISRH